MQRTFSLLAIILIIFANACSVIPSSPSVTQNESKPIVYYYLASPGDIISPDGSVAILANELLLSPIETDQIINSDTVSNVRTALEAMISDSHNNQVIGQVTIANIFFRDGHVEIALQGDVYAAGDIILIAIRMMVLLTVFSDTSIETAIVTLNGKNIVNLGVSFSGNAKPEDYIYTRDEINEFMAENAYTKPR